ncbi:hypothetical protein KEJ42_02230, partial [Candidatus Bathyarchaeota archaeon]|nr:hypothetical protein [Candidatus Bathyarchaeota archaeon]
PVGGFIVDSSYTPSSDGFWLAYLWLVLATSCMLLVFAVHKVLRRFGLISSVNFGLKKPS